MNTQNRKPGYRVRFHRQLLSVMFLVLVPALANAATYYVAKTGSNSNSCAQAASPGSAKLTVAAGLACLSGGDTLIVGDGTYNEQIFRQIPSGTAAARTTLKAANANKAILKPSGTAEHSVIVIHDNDYITIDGMVADAADQPGSAFILTGTASNNIIKNGTARNAHTEWGFGIHTQDPTASYNQVLNMDSYNNGVSGSNKEHGIYMASDGNIIDGNRVYDNEAYGIHIYSNKYSISDNIVRNNFVYNNRLRGVMIQGTGHSFYNNVVYGNAIGVNIDGANLRVLNNTIYNNNNVCIWNQDGSGHKIQNNICYGNASDSIQDSSGGNAISNNLFTNPGFVNSGAADFQLLSSSAAIDRGMTIAETVSDLVGTSRPRAAAWDMGAYEYTGSASAGGTPSQPANLRLVSQ